MAFTVSLGGKGVFTKYTLKGSLAAVCAHVPLQCAPVCAAVVTHLALKWGLVSQLVNWRLEGG